MKKVYFQPEVVTLALSAMGCLMDVSGFSDDMPNSMPQPAPGRLGGKVKVF